MKTITFLLVCCLFQLNIHAACELFDLSIDRTDCNHENKFYLVINFKYHDVSECFTIKGNGRNYGTFKYNQLPVTIGPLAGDCKTEYEFVIRDCKNEHCQLTEHYGKVCCEHNTCELSEMHIERTECDSHGNFCAIINFHHTGNSSCFRLSGNGKEYGKFGYSQLPVKICGLAGDCETEYEFSAKDCIDWECQTTGYLGIVCCEKHCSIHELHLEKTECDHSGKFYVYLDFKHQNNSSCFNVSGNGKDYGNFDYSQLPVKLGPFEGDCKTIYEFIVTDCEDEKCKARKELGKVCCEKPHCEIRDLRISKTDCDSLNNFYVNINFRYFNTSHCFRVRGNGTNYGTFSYSQLPIQIGPLKGDCKKQYEFIIIDCENETCKASKNIGKVCCEYHRHEDESLKGTHTDLQFHEADKLVGSRTSKNLVLETQLYPDKLFIRIGENMNLKDLKSQLFYSTGIPIRDADITLFESEQVLEVNTKQFKPGLYILLIKTQDQQQSIKFLKF